MDDLAGFLRSAWASATGVQPPLEPAGLLLTAAAGVLLVVAPPTWPLVRQGVTVVHEAGHAVVAVLVGRRLRGIRLERDTSGVTVSRGRPRGPGVVAMLAAGYTAPAALGLLAALLLAGGRGVALLWLLVLLVLALLVWVRNLHGLLVLLAGGAGVLGVSGWAPSAVQSVVAHTVAWTLLVAAPRPLLELLRGWRRRRRSSDPDQLARLTRLPALAWAVLLLVADVAALAAGVALLLATSRPPG